MLSYFLKQESILIFIEYYYQNLNAFSDQQIQYHFYSLKNFSKTTDNAYTENYLNFD